MKHRARITEREVKALLTSLRNSQAEYPVELLANRRYMFLGRVPQAGIFIGNKEIFRRILRGLRSTTSLVSKVVLLSVIGMTAAGTILVANNPSWVQAVQDEVNTIRTMVAPVHLPETLPPSPPDGTVRPSKLSETLVPTITPTSTFMRTLTPSITSMATITPPLAPGINPTNTPRVNPTNTPKVNPTNTPKDNNGHHYGQTPTPPGKRTRTP